MDPRLTSPETWLEQAQRRLLGGDAVGARTLLDQAVAAHPGSTALRFALAGMRRQAGDRPAADGLLEGVLAREPGHLAAALQLARSLREQGRVLAAGALLRDSFGHVPGDVESRLVAIELLDDAGRQEDALFLCEQAFAVELDDPRLHVHAAALAAQLGRFEQARVHYETVLARSPQATDWHVPLGLSSLQRYGTTDHPDFERFRHWLDRDELTPYARSGLLFALGKAFDDVGETARAAGFLREANAIMHGLVRWQRKTWRRSVEMRLGRGTLPDPGHVPAEWTPVFIVGMPRAGSTLLAEQLARHPQVRHRGELPWLPVLATRIGAAGSTAATIDAMHDAARTYAEQLAQDDDPVGWYVDKQPHNFLHVDLILALFPHARIIHCRREARDNALSLWMQSFHPGTQDFAYDFGDIATVMRDARRLMEHWQSRFPESVRVVDYESLVADPDACIGALARWLGLPEATVEESTEAVTPALSTASLWQARQPVYRSSVERWRRYAPHLPELERLRLD